MLMCKFWACLDVNISVGKVQCKTDYLFLWCLRLGSWGKISWKQLEWEVIYEAIREKLRGHTTTALGEQITYIHIVLCFSNYYRLPWNSTFGSWLGWYAFSCFCMGGNKVLLFINQSLSFKCPLKSIKLVTYSYHVSIAYTIIVFTSWSFICLFLISV